MAKNDFTNRDDSDFNAPDFNKHERPDGELQNGELVDDEGADYFDDHPARTGVFRLEQYMKAFNIAASGGQAKVLIQSGQVRVNGKIEKRRKRQLQAGDKIQFLGETWQVKIGD
jgi:ribosome-associated protein